MSDGLVPQRARSEGLTTHATRAVAALAVTAFMLTGMWALEVADYLVDHRLDEYGIRSHEVSDLPQIFSAPFLHADFAHIMANSLPFLVLGFLAAARGLSKFAVMNLLVIVVGGAGIWLTAPPRTETLGASILVFGYFGYLLGRGLFERHAADIGIAVVVVLLYGTMILGVLPSTPGISWQGHLFGMIGGVLAAWTLRRRLGQGAG
ncbi:rhomboid family protein [Actinomadura alba]|uniref:Rhomboid family intramembrane serine protease n=1 Tax=Actinomadura alba TaxID=406431 RepID=A0ABR7LQC3_9ACTN|nr:rhomboid family intramembrane serine protease [Actinomadura alba]MBC6466946.1 rhomboid family intramembrane serine protease [Actinomadura alba]